jgi:hypothetical protein
MTERGTEEAVVVAGHLMVDPDARDEYLAGCLDVVRQARETSGCRAALGVGGGVRRRRGAIPDLRASSKPAYAFVTHCVDAANRLSVD